MRVLIVFLAFISFSGCNYFNKKEPPKKNLVFIVIDTLSARYMGIYGAENSPTPNIDRFAELGTIFERSISPAPWTKPSTASLFTGVYPSTHNLRGLKDRLDESAVTLAERLRAHGYQTAGFFSHIFLTENHGFSQGFDEYKLVPFKGNVHNVITSHKVVDLGLKWLEKVKENNDKKPFFLFLHFFDPHYNYKHHENFDRTSEYKGFMRSITDIRGLRKVMNDMGTEDINYLKGLYKEEVAFTDNEIAKIFGYLESNGLSDNTLTVLSADHGEEFLEHGYIGHTRTLFEELIHVPLIFVGPNIKAARIASPVSSVDVTPTIIDYLGLASDEKFAGISLVNSFTTGVVPTNRSIFSEVDFSSSAIKAHKIGVIVDNKKLIYDKPTQTYEAYDLSLDPGELSSIAEKSVFEELKSQIRDFINSDGRLNIDNDSAETIQPEEVESLKSLGYM